MVKSIQGARNNNNLTRNILRMLLVACMLYGWTAGQGQEQYGTTTFRCLVCEGAADVQDCEQNGGIETCPTGDQGGCQTEVRRNAYGAGFTVSNRCKVQDVCLAEAERYGNSCNNASQSQPCYNCCTSDLCNGRSAIGGFTSIAEASTIGPSLTGNNLRCITCTNAENNEQCLAKGDIKTCGTATQTGCQTEVTYLTASRRIINKRCQKLQPCLDLEAQSESCEGEGRTCYMCCTDDLCNIADESLLLTSSTLSSNVKPTPRDPWTLNPGGCSCYYNTSRMDCACCKLGGCQCPMANPNMCAQCGDTLMRDCGIEDRPVNLGLVIGLAVAAFGLLVVVPVALVLCIYKRRKAAWSHDRDTAVSPPAPPAIATLQEGKLVPFDTSDKAFHYEPLRHNSGDSRPASQEDPEPFYESVSETVLPDMTPRGGRAPAIPPPRAAVGGNPPARVPPPLNQTVKHPDADGTPDDDGYAEPRRFAESQLYDDSPDYTPLDETAAPPPPPPPDGAYQGIHQYLQIIS